MMQSRFQTNMHTCEETGTEQAQMHRHTNQVVVVPLPGEGVDRNPKRVHVHACVCSKNKPLGNQRHL